MTDDLGQSVKIVIPSIPDYVGVVRLSASGIATRLNFTLEEIEDIKIVVSEACTNAVLYAYPDTIGEVEIIFTIKKDRLEIFVNDNGVGFNVENPLISREQNKTERVGLGLGITFMRSLMDKVEYDTSIKQGTHLKLVKYVSSQNDSSVA